MLSIQYLYHALIYTNLIDISRYRVAQSFVYTVTELYETLYIQYLYHALIYTNLIDISRYAITQNFIYTKEVTWV